MNENLLISLVFAHIIADFYIQTEALVRQKEEKKLKAWFTYVHPLSVGLLSWSLVPNLPFVWYVLLITLSHWAIDVIKLYYGKGMWGFLVDQLVHALVIVWVAYNFVIDVELPVEWFDLDAVSVPRLAVAVLLCLKPANILIKLVLKKYRVIADDETDGLENAGALIGNLERLLTVLFVLIGQYGAIGFIVAAKSLLRFKDTDTAKTEYVLAGTFLSFGIAIILGLMV